VSAIMPYRYAALTRHAIVRAELRRTVDEFLIEYTP
jgi:hypothetical protein